jgi:hypothetical protein
MIGLVMLLSPALGAMEDMTGNDPVVLVAGPAHDFGVARQEDRLEHRFRIENRGQADLVIEEIEKPCDGDAEDITGRRVPPGGAIPFTVGWETKGYEGTHSRIIELRTNDPRTPAVELELTARVCTDFAIQPRSLALAKGAGGYPLEGKVRVIQCNGEPWVLSAVDASATWLSLSWEHISEARGGGYIVRVGVKEGVPPGRHAEVISLHLDQERSTEIDVPVIVQIGTQTAVRVSTATPDQ